MFGSITNDISLYRNAYFITVSAMMARLLSGWDTGMTGGVLAIESFQKRFGLDKLSAGDRATLSGNFGGVLSGGSFFGALFTGYFIQRFGRKPCLVAAGIINVVGSVIESISGLGSSADVGFRVLYLGRFLCGLGEGMGTAIFLSYVSESVPATIRGRCVGAGNLAYVSGVTLSYWINYGASKHIPITDMQWRILFMLKIIPGIIFSLSILCQPESPRWLVEHEKYDKAAKSLAYSTRTTPDDVVVLETINKIRLDYLGRDKLSLFAQVKGMAESRSIAIRCIIPSLLALFDQFSGSPAVSTYGPQIFSQIGLSGTTAGLLATGVYGIVKVLCSIMFAFVVERIGRKKGLIFGGLGQGLAMFWIAGYSAVHPTGKIVPAGYVSVVAVCIYGISYSTGWGPLHYAVQGEVAPNHLRPVALAISACIQWMLTFALAEVTPIMLNNIKYGTYIFFGSWSIIMVIWVYVFLPETKGYALEDIKYLFEGDVILRSLQDSPGGRIFIGKRRALSVEELQAQNESRRKDENGETKADSDSRF